MGKHWLSKFNEDVDRLRTPEQRAAARKAMDEARRSGYFDPKPAVHPLANDGG